MCTLQKMRSFIYPYLKKNWEVMGLLLGQMVYSQLMSLYSSTIRDVTAVRSLSPTTREQPRSPQPVKSLHSNQGSAESKNKYIKKIKGKGPPANAGDEVSIPRLERSLGGGNDTLLQSCLEHSTGRGIWWATVLWAAKHWT